VPLIGVYDTDVLVKVAGVPTDAQHFRVIWRRDRFSHVARRQRTEEFRDSMIEVVVPREV
jgi:hypothetical protein